MNTAWTWTRDIRHVAVFALVWFAAAGALSSPPRSVHTDPDMSAADERYSPAATSNRSKDPVFGDVDETLTPRQLRIQAAKYLRQERAAKEAKARRRYIRESYDRQLANGRYAQAEPGYAADAWLRIQYDASMRIIACLNPPSCQRRRY